MDGTKREEPKKGRRFSQDQYDMLLRCSKKKDITEWNEWRLANRCEDILLEGALLCGCWLNGVCLSKGELERDSGVYLHGRVCLQHAQLIDAHLERADMRWADMEGALLEDADLQRARMDNTGLEHAKLSLARMQGTSLNGARLEGADLGKTQLQNAILTYARLTGARLDHANLEGAQLYDARMGGATFAYAIVNGATWIHDSQVDAATDFRGVSLGAMRIDAGTKQLLEYNMRRMNWEDWYKEHPLLKWLVGPFWLMSDYGRSTGRIVTVFFILALFFAAIYANCTYWWPPGIVSNLVVEPHFPLWHYFLLLLLRPIYFSVVTMTTLGFGDMYANAQSIWGHILLSVQVILGYVLLGALVTRFAVLFTAGGPAGKFSD